MRLTIGSGVILAATLIAPCVARAQAVVQGDVQIGAPSSPQAPPPQNAPPQNAQPQYAGQPPQYAGQPPPGYAPYGQPQQPVYVVQAGGGVYYGRSREYLGGPIPPGMHVSSHVSTPLVIAGALTFGIPWFFSTIAAPFTSSSSGAGLWLILPVFGPIGFAASTCCLDPGTVGLLALDAIAQAGGIVMLIAGAVVRQRTLVPDYFGANHSRAPRFAVLPVAPGALAGASLSAAWF